MKEFLLQPEVAFYHVTTIESWSKIRTDGFRSKSGKIFVSRFGDLPVLFAIAVQQLPEIYATEAIVFLKFPQSKNNFDAYEITSDPQAGVEWTQPFQNIILRKEIPIKNIELMMVLYLGSGGLRQNLITRLTKIADTARVEYLNHPIMVKAKEIKLFVQPPL